MKHARRWKKGKKQKLQLSARLDRQLKANEEKRAAEPTPEDASAAKATKWMHPVRVVLLTLLFAAVSVVVWILPLRPTHSDFEQRDLAAFPAWSMETMLSGEYFDDMSLWFSDTFPGRETWVNLSAAIRHCFGLRGETIHGNIQQADTIPSAPSTTTTASSTTTSSSATTTTTTTTTTATATTTTSTGTTTTTTTVDKDIQNQNQNLGAILVRGDMAFEYYAFVRSTADKYINVINDAGNRLKGTATVYDMLVPTSIDVMLPASERPSASSDQGAAIAYMYGSMNGNVKTVDARSALLAHNKEYLYFHTDHHWTALGAYYAYDAFMQAQGKTATPLADYKQHAFDGFLGSFYADTKDTDLKLGADTVYAYEPFGNVTMTYRKDTNGAENPYKVITDVTNWSARYKYNTFIAGDQPLVTITNHDIKDNSSIVLVKESFGNAFAPLLASQYHKVYVLDYRYYTGGLQDFVKSHNVSTVLFLNNMSATRNSYLVGKMDDLVR
ncbi:MAG: hypothetical protein IJ465_00585 [Clostridia bacterium]|nr:hypothetical protein [Clostridia bacterium]